MCKLRWMRFYENLNLMMPRASLYLRTNKRDHRRSKNQRDLNRALEDRREVKFSEEEARQWANAQLI